MPGLFEKRSIAAVQIDGFRAHLASDHPGGKVVWVTAREGSLFGVSTERALAEQGRSDIGPLDNSERATLRAFLHSCEPVLWDRAPAHLKAALRNKPG